jgi:hypothetical protein
MCPNYESHNICETRAEDFHANDGGLRGCNLAILSSTVKFRLSKVCPASVPPYLIENTVCLSYKDQLWGDRSECEVSFHLYQILT